MQLSSQIKHQSPQSDRLSIFWAIPSPKLSHFSVRAIHCNSSIQGFPNAFSGVSVSIPIAETVLPQNKKTAKNAVFNDNILKF
jgi:hypothetical protein